MAKIWNMLFMSESDVTYFEQKYDEALENTDINLAYIDDIRFMNNKRSALLERLTAVADIDNINHGTYPFIVRCDLERTFRADDNCGVYRDFGEFEIFYSIIKFDKEYPDDEIKFIDIYDAEDCQKFDRLYAYQPFDLYDRFFVVYHKGADRDYPELLNLNELIERQTKVENLIDVNEIENFSNGQTVVLDFNISDKFKMKILEYPKEHANQLPLMYLDEFIDTLVDNPDILQSIDFGNRAKFPVQEFSVYIRNKIDMLTADKLVSKLEHGIPQNVISAMYDDFIRIRRESYYVNMPCVCKINLSDIKNGSAKFISCNSNRLEFFEQKDALSIQQLMIMSKRRKPIDNPSGVQLRNDFNPDNIQNEYFVRINDDDELKFLEEFLTKTGFDDVRIHDDLSAQCDDDVLIPSPILVNMNVRNRTVGIYSRDVDTIFNSYYSNEYFSAIAMIDYLANYPDNFKAKMKPKPEDVKSNDTNNPPKQIEPDSANDIDKNTGLTTEQIREKTIKLHRAR